MSMQRSVLFVGAALLSLTACGELREDLGLGRNSPDEFAVVDRPPLTMPPDYALRPPRPGAPRPQVTNTDEQAGAAVFGGKARAGGAAASESEKAILESAGAAKADANIREVVGRESAQKASASPSLVNRLLNWSGDEAAQKPATTVDAEAEAERIKKAKEDNQPITSGATPVIEKKKSGWLGL